MTGVTMPCTQVADVAFLIFRIVVPVGVGDHYPSAIRDISYGISDSRSLGDCSARVF